MLCTPKMYPLCLVTYLAWFFYKNVAANQFYFINFGLLGQNDMPPMCSDTMKSTVLVLCMVILFLLKWNYFWTEKIKRNWMYYFLTYVNCVYIFEMWNNTYVEDELAYYGAVICVQSSINDFLTFIIFVLMFVTILI